jgi:hypothetical protein
MSEHWAESRYVGLVKAILKDSGFSWKGHKASYRNGELQVQIAFRNRWSAPIPDLYITVSDKDCGEILQSDLYFVNTGFNELITQLREEDLQEMDNAVEARVRSVFVDQVIPELKSFSVQSHFLHLVDTERFKGNGVWLQAVAKLRQKMASARPS